MTQGLVAVAVVALAICHMSVHGLAKGPPNATQEYLDAHNIARAQVGVGPLQWSDTVASEARLWVRYQRNKQDCAMAQLRRAKYGGNQFWEAGVQASPRLVVDLWVQQKMYYNHSDNSCAPYHDCGAYTQVVWSKTLELGCARAACGNDTVSLTICFYNPPGNILGQSPY